MPIEPAARRPPLFEDPRRMKLLLLPIVVGAGLRWFRVSEQVLIWDELHTVRTALEAPIGTIVSTWTRIGADFCVPLTAFYRFLLDRGVELSELGFRLPVLLFGFLGLLVIPLGLAPKLGRRAAIVLGWLLAVSPLYVLYSRIVRSYAPMLLLAFGAILAFRRWRETRSRLAGAAYVGLAASAVYFHIGVAPFVLAPFLFALLQTLASGCGWREVRRRLLGFAPLLAALALALCVLLYPARNSLLELTQTHRGASVPSLQAWVDATRLLIGTPSVPLAIVTAALGLRGFWILLRKERELAGFLLLLAAVHVGGLLVLRPLMLEKIVVLARYLIVLLPFGLGLVAIGLSEPFTSTRRARIVQNAATVAFLLALFATGPLFSAEFLRGTFVHHPRFMQFLAPRTASQEISPPFYAAENTGAGGIIEYPWDNLSSSVFYVHHQARPRTVRVATNDALLLDPRLDLRNVVAASPRAFLESGMRFVVVHLDPGAELFRLQSLEGSNRAIGSLRFWRRMRTFGTVMSARLSRRWGPPTEADDSIHVWDLRKVQARRDD